MTTRLEWRIEHPYCAEKISSDPDDNRWLLLNREYQPLGYWKCEDPDRNKFVIALPRQTIDRLKELAVKSSGSLVWLYTDSCTPWSSSANKTAYLARLKKLRLPL